MIALGGPFNGILCRHAPPDRGLQERTERQFISLGKMADRPHLERVHRVDGAHTMVREAARELAEGDGRLNVRADELVDGRVRCDVLLHRGGLVWHHLLHNRQGLGLQVVVDLPEHASGSSIILVAEVAKNVALHQAALTALDPLHLRLTNHGDLAERL